MTSHANADASAADSEEFVETYEVQSKDDVDRAGVCTWQVVGESLLLERVRRQGEDCVTYNLLKRDTNAGADAATYTCCGRMSVLRYGVFDSARVVANFLTRSEP